MNPNQNPVSLPDQIQTRMVWVTRDWAQRALDNMIANRPLSIKDARKIARDFVGNTYNPLASTIKVMEDGRTADGRTRLTGFLLSGIPGVWMRVEYGYTADTIKYMDGNRARSVADRLYMASGDISLKLKTEIAFPILVALDGRSNAKPNETEIEDMIGKLSDGIDFVQAPEVLARPAGGRLSRGILGGLAIAYKTDPRRLEDFKTSARTGANLESGSPVLVFRDFFLSERVSSNVSKHRSDPLYKTLTCIQRYLEGAKMRQLKAPTSRESQKALLDYFGKAHGIVAANHQE